ncbi:chorismate mutase [Phenylobacterium deserti]|uniref:chorismate mutase n=1 Tax=Phenylobacterium deserti TaxID=1914756 RepID=A0A328ASF3_9CAUL|nr:chorismate mutase [Phenylobacterium deserti]RAK57900.1 chorismate mutase [Phenylobacterium deserti]
MAEATPAPAPSLDEVRTRIDAIDRELLRLLDERAGLARAVAAAKAASGDTQRFGLRPGREAEILRRLLAEPRMAATPALVVRVWRELMAESLSLQGPFNVSVWGGARTVELARMRFGAAPPLQAVAKPEEALAAARVKGGVAALALTPDSAWWGRLLAEPRIKVFAALPCLAAWGPMSALAVADVDVEPTGDDRTFWVTDASQSAAAIEEALSRDGVAATPLLQAGGLKLFLLSGFYQRDDERLARAPGRLSGVIGAAPGPLDV